MYLVCVRIRSLFHCVTKQVGARCSVILSLAVVHAGIIIMTSSGRIRRFGPPCHSSNHRIPPMQYGSKASEDLLDYWFCVLELQL